MPEIGEKLSQYTIISAIGSGGMGRVYLAEDTKLGRRIALKFLAPEFASNREHLDRFIREARASSALNHPNICTIHEINDEADPPYIAMEFVEGETVAEMIRRRRRNVQQAVEIAIQTAEALADAHSNGIVHRDIKPANIIVNKHGRVKILDFGLAKRMFAGEAQPDGQFQTHAGVVLGTASYMSPEQARGLTVDSRTDVWSLGVVLYEMLTGKLPFSGDTAADTFASLLTREPEPASAIVGEIPHELNALVMRALSRQREKRFQSMNDLLAELRTIRQGHFDPDALAHSPHVTNANTDEPTEVFHTAPTEHNPPPGTDRDAPVRHTNPNNLTATHARIIGREPEIASIASLLLDPDVRLVTMTGIGGTGKTTLSRAVARRLLPEFENGVFFIEMADVSRPDVVASTIAQPLGVKEEGGRPLLDVLKDHLADKHMLLIIDNFEQVVDAAPQIAELLTASRMLKILVTTRELLRLTAEVEFQVPPLTVPDPGGESSFDDLRANEAVMLFAERARAARPSFVLTPENIADAAAICSRLDGLPLAIELAAARVKILSPGNVLSKLDNRLNLLTGGARDLPKRQKTMRGAVLWSYELLNDEEKAVFALLSVFSGGFRIDSAEHVCGPAAESFSAETIDVISSLIDKSLLLKKETKDGESRFRMLEVVRDFAHEMLDAGGQVDEARRRHAEFFVGLAETAEPLLQGAQSDIWLAKLEEEHDNLRAAMEWGLANEPGLATRLAVAARNYWLVHSHLSEGFGWLKAVSESGFEPPPGLRFKLLNGLGLVARFRGDFETAREAYSAGLAAGQEAGDKPGTALSNRGLGLVAMQQGDLSAAKNHFDAGLAISRDLEDAYGIAMSLSFLGDLARTEGRFAEAKPHFEEAAGLFQGLHNRTALSDTLNNLGATKVCLGETAEAAVHFVEALVSANELSNRITISFSLDGLAAVAVENGHLEKAAILAAAAAHLRDLIGYKIEPAEAGFRSRYLQKLNGMIAEPDMQRLSDMGRRMPLEDAVAEALAAVKSDEPAAAERS